MPVNGKYYSWEDLTVHLPNGVQLDLTEIEYEGSCEGESIYGQGSAPRGYGRGNYKAEGKLKMKREQYDFLLIYVASTGKSIFRLAPFTISAVYGNDAQGLSTDQVLKCRFEKSSKKAAQGDKSLDVELSFSAEDIEENGVSQAAGLNKA